MSKRLLNSRLYNDPCYGADLRAAHYHAHRLGLCDADCEDCAMEYLLSRLLRNRSHNDPTDAAWRHRCASNFAKNSRRTLSNRSRYESPDDAIETLDAPTIPAEQPEAEVLRKEFWNEVRECVDQLRPVPRQMFLRYYTGGETIQELATAFSEKPHSVEQKLYRARARFRTLLLERGVDASTLQDYLQPVQKA